MNANEVKVGQVVEFEPGSPVHVLSIEDNWGPGEEDPSDPYYLRMWGKSLVFSCSFDGVNSDVHTLYVRRELSPLSGPRVVR
jgi:hypothetical protein